MIPAFEVERAAESRRVAPGCRHFIAGKARRRSRNFQITCGINCAAEGKPRVSGSRCFISGKYGFAKREIPRKINGAAGRFPERRNTIFREGRTRICGENAAEISGTAARNFPVRTVVRESCGLKRRRSRRLINCPASRSAEPIASRSIHRKHFIVFKSQICRI